MSKSSTRTSIHAKGHGVQISTDWLNEEAPHDKDNVRLLNITAGEHEITIFLNRDDNITFTTPKGDL